MNLLNEKKRPGVVAERRGKLAGLLLSGTLAMVAGNAQAYIIDTFNNAPGSTQLQGTQLAAPATDAGQSGPSDQIIGAGGGNGYRDVIVSKVMGVSSSSRKAEVKIGPDPGIDTLNVSNDSGTDSDIFLVWDGSHSVSAGIVTNMNANLNQTGLFSGITGVDLTEGGSKRGFALDILSIDLSANLRITVYSGDNGTGGATAIGSADSGFSGAGKLFIPFEAFTGSVAFNNVGAIAMRFTGNANWDAEVDLFQTVPEPTGIMLLGVGLAAMGYSKGRAKKASAV